MRVRTSATQKLWPFCGIVVHVQGCAPRKIEGSPIQGAQHMMSMRKLKFSSHLLGQLKLDARGHWALLELSLDVACYYLIFIYFMFVFSKKEAD